YRWLPDPLGPDDVERPGALRIDRIREQVASGRLYQKGRVPDEGDDRGSAAERRRDPHGYVHVTRPRCSPFEEHARDRREGLSGCAGRIEEALPVEAIGHRWRGGLVVGCCCWLLVIIGDNQEPGTSNMVGRTLSH